MGVPPQVRTFSRQSWVLTKKTLLILLVRRPLSTLFQAAILPIIIIFILCYAKDLARDGNHYGVGTPAPVRTLRSSLRSSGRLLVIVAPPTLGPDIDAAINTIAEPLSSSRVSRQVVRLEDEDDVVRVCPVNARGLSPCHAVLIFNDSPLTDGGNRTWTYTIQTDPARQPGADHFDTGSHSNSPDIYFLPLQVAVDNAITNSTVVPEAYMYTQQSDEWIVKHYQMFYLEVLIAALSLVPFITYLPAIAHVTSTVTTDRAEGLAQLIDIMGAGPAARVYSYVAAFGILYMPCWVGSGLLYWYYLFPASSPGLLILWQVLTGWSITSASVTASTFFKRNRVSGVCVALGFLACAIRATRSVIRAKTVSVSLCSLLVPSMNFVYAITHIARFQLASRPVELSASKPPAQRVDPFFPPQSFSVSLGAFLAFLAAQVVLSPLLAVTLERCLYGLHQKDRTMCLHSGSTNDSVAVDVVDLRKVYRPSWSARLLRQGKQLQVAALDGISLRARKSQLLCLLGVNGSGKTTTLSLIAGQQSPTSGHIRIGMTPAHLGLCPQKNVLFSRLTVFEHVKFWSQLKGGTETAEELKHLVGRCGLARKPNSQARTLSGGQKRKLQLACMLAGGSDVCLMDEATSGLDPLSRRAIWNVVLAERTRRSIIFTTHFLDEGEVLADHVVILSKGRVKCEGSSAELRNRFGGGYRVLVPGTERPLDVDAPVSRQQGCTAYAAPDSRSAARIVEKLEASGLQDVRLAGPTMETVFLNATDDMSNTGQDSSDVVSTLKPSGPASSAYGLASQKPNEPAHFLRQVLVLIGKRFNVLPRYVAAPLLALAIPVILIPLLKLTLRDYHPPSCERIRDIESFRNPTELWSSRSTEVLIGPPSVNETLSHVLGHRLVGRNFNASMYNETFHFCGDYGSFRRMVTTGAPRIHPGAIYAGDESGPPTVAYSGSGWLSSAVLLHNVLAQIRSGQEIQVYLQSLPEKGENDANDSLEYVLYATVILAIYPAFFTLYPAYEKTHKIKYLQYSNGVRPAALWTAHLLFDSLLVILVSAAVTATLASQFAGVWFAPGWLFPVLVLYGLAAALVAYIMSTLARSQIAAFFSSAGFMVLAFAAVVISYLTIFGGTDRGAVQPASDRLSLLLGALFPITNLFKSLAVGLNLMRLGCRDDGLVSSPLSLHAYGGPIMLLCVQGLLLGLILLSAEGAVRVPFSVKRLVSRSRPRPRACDPETKAEAGQATPEAPPEASPSLLSLSHASKSFGATLALDDLSLSLRRGEILALLGPNGAGKTTTLQLVRGALAPSGGAIRLDGADVCRDPRRARRALGVCPQFDALDLLTPRQHLALYARVRGARGADVGAAVADTLRRVGLDPRSPAAARRPARHLSGGDRRKLSLGIALMGAPPVLLLDEPSSSMDAAAKRALWRALRAVAAAGRSLLLTTHSMEEADAVATRAAILAGGRLLAEGPAEALRRRCGGGAYHAHLVLRSAPASPAAETRSVEAWLRGRLGPAAVEIDGASFGGQIRFTIPGGGAPSSSGSGAGPSSRRGEGGRHGAPPGPHSVARVIRALEANKDALGVAHYSIGAPTLESVFLNVMQDAGVVEEPERPRRRWWRWRG